MQQHRGLSPIIVQHARLPASCCWCTSASRCQGRIQRWMWRMGQGGPLPAWGRRMQCPASDRRLGPAGGLPCLCRCQIWHSSGRGTIEAVRAVGVAAAANPRLASDSGFCPCIIGPRRGFLFFLETMAKLSPQSPPTPTSCFFPNWASLRLSGAVSMLGAGGHAEQSNHPH